MPWPQWKFEKRGLVKKNGPSKKQRVGIPVAVFLVLLDFLPSFQRDTSGERFGFLFRLSFITCTHFVYVVEN
jgi:hypothetical protein